MTHTVLFRFVALRLNQFPTHPLWYNEKLIPYKSEGITKDFQNSSSAAAAVSSNNNKKRGSAFT